MTPQHDDASGSKPPSRQDAKAEPSLEHDLVARQIVDSAFCVHTALGPGLLESVYEQCLVAELTARKVPVKRQTAVPLVYRNVRIDVGFRMDLVVDSLVVVEIKSIEKFMPIHEAQLLTYLKLSGLRLGILINFNVPRIKDGLLRIVLSP